MSKQRCRTGLPVLALVLAVLVLGAAAPAAAQFRADRYSAPPMPEDLLWNR
jgi:hypothetical protein